MPEYFSEPQYTVNLSSGKKKHKNKYLVHIVLFLLTLITTVVAGMQWIIGPVGPYHISALILGIPYGISILFILSCHEFGHFFAAKFHKVKSTLPYFIPVPSLPFFINFGTMGAVIKTKTPVPSNKAMFDIGVAGPIAGFFASIIVLIYGFTHLPGVQYILTIHPDYFSTVYAKNALNLEFGDSLLFTLIRGIFADPGQFVPPMSEIYHYPYLCVGWFGLFITAMNMIPVGQLDGGHIIYSMFGEKKHFLIAQISMGILIIIGLVGVGDMALGWNSKIGWYGWLLWSTILYFVIKVKHPPVAEFEQLGPVRMLIGYFSILILIMCFSPSPINFSL